MARVAEAFRATYTVPGLSIAIAQHGRLVYAEAFGVADRDTSEALTPNHRFRIASVTKPITATTIFCLIEQGRLRLQDRVFGPGGVLGDGFGGPPFQPDVDRITIEQLLTHTAGGWSNDDRDPMFHHPTWSQQELIERTIHDVPLDRLPGTSYAYSNFGYCVLGRVIEHLTGRRYDDFVRQEVLGRCDVTDMTIGGNTLADRQPMEVQYYGQGGEDPYGFNLARMDSHGGWVARPIDLVDFALRVDGFAVPPDILQPATVRIMTTPSAANPHYAHGWQVNAFDNWWHLGSLPGTVTVMVRTHSGFCWAAFANTRRPRSMIERDIDRLPWAMLKQVAAWQGQ